MVGAAAPTWIASNGPTNTVSQFPDSLPLPRTYQPLRSLRRSVSGNLDHREVPLTLPPIPRDHHDVPTLQRTAESVALQVRLRPVDKLRDVLDPDDGAGHA